MRRRPSRSNTRRNVRAAMLTFAFATGASSALADAATEPPSLPTEWMQWNGHHYRLEADGHLSCYAEDSSRPNTCSLNAPTAKGWPLKCDDPRWGGDNRKRTGYQVIDHWCNAGYANLFATWVSYKPLGHNVELATGPRGDVMCKSVDGTTCLPAGAPTPPSGLNPLVCGRMLRDRTGSKGYNDTKHWCSSREIVPVFAGAERNLLWNGEDRYGPAGGIVDREWWFQETVDIPLPRWTGDDQAEWVVRMERVFATPLDWNPLYPRKTAVTVGLSRGDSAGDLLDRPFAIWSASRDEPPLRQGSDQLVVVVSEKADGSIEFKHQGTPLGFRGDDGRAWDLAWRPEVRASEPFKWLLDQRAANGAPWSVHYKATPRHLQMLHVGSGVVASNAHRSTMLRVTDVTFTRKRKIPAF